MAQSRHGSSTACPEPGEGTPAFRRRTSIRLRLLDPHVDYLLGRIGEGCENAMALWRELRARGYPGTSRQVHRFVAERRTKPTRSGRKPRGGTILVPETPAVGQSLPSARQLAWLLV